jgi:hypothetical protein
VSAQCIISVSSKGGPQWIVVDATGPDHTIFKHYMCREEAAKLYARLNDPASERRLTFERTDRHLWANPTDTPQRLLVCS